MSARGLCLVLRSPMRSDFLQNGPVFLVAETGARRAPPPSERGALSLSFNRRIRNMSVGLRWVAGASAREGGPSSKWPIWARNPLRSAIERALSARPAPVFRCHRPQWCPAQLPSALYRPYSRIRSSTDPNGRRRPWAELGPNGVNLSYWATGLY